MDGSSKILGLKTTNEETLLIVRVDKNGLAAACVFFGIERAGETKQENKDATNFHNRRVCGVA